MLATQLKYDLLMFSRELFYLVFTIVVPPVTYIFMGQLFGDQTYAGNLSYAQTYTPSFILLITFTTVFFAFGFDQVTHRTTGVEKRIRLSPVSKNTLLLSSIIRSIIITSFGYLFIYAIGMLMYDLQFHVLNFIMAYGFFIATQCRSARHRICHLLFFQRDEKRISVLHRHFPSRYLYRRLCTSNQYDAEVHTSYRRI